jgi:HEAT repeat protein
LGAKSRPAIPELIRVAREDDDSSVRTEAAFALGEIANRDDSAVVEALVAATKDKEAKVRDFAGLALMRIDTEAASKAGITNNPNRLRYTPSY